MHRQGWNQSTSPTLPIDNTASMGHTVVSVLSCWPLGTLPALIHLYQVARLIGSWPGWPVLVLRQMSLTRRSAPAGYCCGECCAGHAALLVAVNSCKPSHGTVARGSGSGWVRWRPQSGR